MNKTLKKIILFGINSVSFFNGWFLRHFLPLEQRKKLVDSCDPVRYGAVLLALNNIAKNNIGGALAEAGVYQGTLSKFIHSIAPQRTLYLFDTFEGFPKELLNGRKDTRFSDTSIDAVKKNIGDTNNVVFKQGFFPDSAADLKNEKFAFAMIDFDLYASIKAALEFFYPRVNAGGYIFLHDYNSPESEWGVSRAVTEFLRDKPEKIVEIPDVGGTVIIRKT